MAAPSHAASTTLVIAQIQAGASSAEPVAPTQEFISVYNNSTQDVDVTGWCLANKSSVNFACVAPSIAGQKLYISSHQYMIIASDSFVTHHPGLTPDVIFQTTNATSGSLTGSADTVTLKDSANGVVDSVQWTASLSGGTVLQRSAATSLVNLIDTDVIADFVKLQGVIMSTSGLYEVVTVTDQCRNIDDVQAAIPDGYIQDVEGQCFIDICLNLDGLQADIPEEYYLRGIGECVYDYALLRITEMLPNVSGSDVDHEFIELYNPTNRVVKLINYQLKVGSKLYDFPVGSIGPSEYKTFYNNEIGFTLTNTTLIVTLLADDGSVIDQPVSYDAPAEDMAWALLDQLWQYSNQPTPGSENHGSVIQVEEKVEESMPRQLTPCATNQYRHPETNRCRLLVTLASTVTACKDGQYRSEETNRCRTIALAGGTLTPCREDQYRSEETNRCRNLATAASTLTPCKDNQYRSEETNRCRNIVAAAVPASGFAVEPVAESAKTFVGWWALGGVVTLALGYGVWEWRREIATGAGRLATFFRPRK